MQLLRHVLAAALIELLFILSISLVLLFILSLFPLNSLMHFSVSGNGTAFGIQSLIPATEITKPSYLKQTIKEKDGAETIKEVESGIEKEVSQIPRVLALIAVLVTIGGFLGGCLWAIVALCRNE